MTSLISETSFLIKSYCICIHFASSPTPFLPKLHLPAFPSPPALKASVFLLFPPTARPEAQRGSSQQQVPTDRLGHIRQRGTCSPCVSQPSHCENIYKVCFPPQHGFPQSFVGLSTYNLFFAAIFELSLFIKKEHRWCERDMSFK